MDLNHVHWVNCLLDLIIECRVIIEFSVAKTNFENRNAKLIEMSTTLRDI